MNGYNKKIPQYEMNHATEIKKKDSSRIILGNFSLTDKIFDVIIERVPVRRLFVMDKNKTDINNQDSAVPGLVRLSDITPEEVKFIWFPYLPHAKLTLVRGDGDQGKTSFCLKLAATISTGGSLPNGDGSFTQVEPGNVLFISAEDGLKDTLIPQLIKIGADRSRVFGYDNTEPETPVLDFTHPLFEQLIAKTNPTLVCVDPLQGFFGNKDMNRANHVRPIMSHLRTLAEKYDCSIVLIEHMGKSGRGSGFHRGLCSIDITSAARSILMVGSDPDNPDERGICHIKSNLSHKGTVIGFRINDSGIVWNPDTYLTADIIEGKPKNKNSEISALEEAKEFLFDVLRDGKQTSRDIWIAAKQNGISEPTLKRARADLDIDCSEREGFGKDTIVYWKFQ